MKKKNEKSEKSEIVLYQTGDGNTRLEVRFEGETVWLTQSQMAELFQTTKQNISLHIQNVFSEKELEKGGTVKEYLTVQSEGGRQVKREMEHYNLDVIISVGYRVKSRIGTQFRIWATQRLREYIVKGFVLDAERLKNPAGSGVFDYFEELLERIRDIRASEKRMYLRVREIFALAADYEASDVETQNFFQVIQNKLHFATTGKTAPELIAGRVDHKKPNMGLTSWKGEVVRKADVGIAKNYLRENEISELNRIVVMFLDFAEDQSERRKQIFMKDWKQKLDDFLRFNDRSVLPGPGSIRRETAERLANAEYDTFEKERRTQLEAQGEADTMRQLEDVAKKIKKRKKK